ncbi:CubicO group peptidase (beta-lactamase class C family) [Natranaerovirga hydrolytica]|uniref:CubicO group peptidase (Beta-lactamase class C family) n=1 Tax=Natranaerovirga hydrolytica TaxID=680378 RepID=A0A4R1MGW8_9FIRM|nr:serine hydrolase domain-containing protein [Natranaerovirga hydrolytica]TCK89153.1 CubicO group peptidase (beta-lactamase class C family) [Natranaerovirga hydrolytica]
MFGKNISISGDVAQGFEPVKEEFQNNFHKRKELGAACTIFYKGEKVVDLWGGYRKGNEKWQKDTMLLIFSATKGIASIVMAKLHSEGLLNYNEKVAVYWPEFAQNGKENITVKHLLTHQAGLVLLDNKLPVSQLNDFDKTAKVLAEAKALWEPGIYQGYQAGTVGFYMGELVRRIDKKGRSLGRFFQEEIAQPLNLDFYIGLPENISDNIIANIKMINPALALFNLNKMPEGMRSIMLTMNSYFMKSTTLIKGYNPNNRETWRVEQPSGNGIGTARSVAYLYSILANGGKELNISDSTFNCLNAPPERPVQGYLDKVINIETRYGLGFMKPDPEFHFSDNSNAFGFLGATGSFAFADPQKHIGYAYLTRKMGYYGVNDPREKSIREAMYRCIAQLEKGELDHF